MAENGAEARPRYLLGFSATPFRLDKEPLCPEPFAGVIQPVTPMELIQQKLLCPAVIESPLVCGPDGEPRPINQASNPEEIYHQAVRYALGQGRSRILLYVSQTQEHSPVQVDTEDHPAAPTGRHQRRGSPPEYLGQ